MKTEFRLNLKIECTHDIHKFWSHAEKHFDDRGPYHIENSPLICSGFYMSGTSVMKRFNIWDSTNKQDEQESRLFAINHDVLAAGS